MELVDVIFATLIILIVVFAVAGVAKLAALRSWTATLRDMGVPARLVTVTSVVVPLAELCIAGGLAIPAGRRVAAGSAVLALIGFTALLIVKRRRGETFSCQCFGQLSAAPVGRFALARNIVLLSLAVLVSWQVESDAAVATTSLRDLPPRWLLRDVPLTISLLTTAGLGVLLLLRWRQRAASLRRLERVPHSPSDGGGAVRLLDESTRLEAPDLSLTLVSGEVVRLSSLRGRRVFVLFWDPNCPHCGTVLRDVQALVSASRPLQIVVVSSSPFDEVPMEVSSHFAVAVDEEFTVAAAFDAPGTPSAVLIDPAGRIESPVAAGPAQVSALLAIGADNQRQPSAGATCFTTLSITCAL